MPSNLTTGLRLALPSAKHRATWFQGNQPHRLLTLHHDKGCGNPSVSSGEIQETSYPDNCKEQTHRQGTIGNLGDADDAYAVVTWMNAAPAILEFLEATEARHVEDDTHHCRGCHVLWPCDDYVALLDLRARVR